MGTVSVTRRVAVLESERGAVGQIERKNKRRVQPATGGNPSLSLHGCDPSKVAMTPGGTHSSVTSDTLAHVTSVTYNKLPPRPVTLAAHGGSYPSAPPCGPGVLDPAVRRCNSRARAATLASYETSAAPFQSRAKVRHAPAIPASACVPTTSTTKNTYGCFRA
ncbi:hypothetical protein SKAU_G00394920 [Synaphobranchus kaupii]|uniref:Uncharacterized protein n=1 Tax=Synaphobranchus kaupii TaxID=118154 RepID=A0A9Q1IDZ6_SYNKA|nr:hypothetical protein SKAU_G00394920 [Synaphobranchus kaupii]